MNVNNSPIENMRQRRQDLRDEQDQLRREVGAFEQRSSSGGLNAQDARNLDRLTGRLVQVRDDLSQTDDRLMELVTAERRESIDAQTTRALGDPAEQRGSRSPFYASSQTYHRGATSPSYFADLVHSQRGDADAADRLRTNNREVGLESRALGNTTGTGGSGGEFAPPGWLIEDWVRLARPGRVTADLFHHEDLPPGISTVNLPKMLSGTATAPQTTQNTTLANVDATTGALSSTIVTIGGKQVVSQQLLDQAPGSFDRIILEDLAADYARQLGLQVLTGTGTAGSLKGYLTPTSSNVVTWTQATPTAAGFYSQLAKLQGQINATRFKAPDAVIMHPRRWAWLASYTDSTGRPLIAPTAGGFNSLGTSGSGAASGLVGQVLGMDVFTDASIPTTLGAGTNQDAVLMLPRDDVWLWESNLRAEAFQAFAADSLSVLLRVYNYAAMIPDRYLSSLGQIQGTGLVTPTFAS